MPDSTSLLNPVDWAIVAAFFVVSLAIGTWVSKRAGSSAKEFFLSGRDMPWWLLGTSMVATTFAIDTPNLVAGIVRSDGVAGNWVWWGLLVSGMVTVHVFAKLWRRAGVMTDVEFYELRYSGRAASFLRGFRALYLGLIFNVLVMGVVSLAAIKFGEIVLGVPAWQMLLVSGLGVMVYSSLGGLRGVILTDFVQFGLAMVGSIWAAVHLVGHERVGGLDRLLANPEVSERLALMPSLGDPDQWVPLLLVPLAIQWWASYYPGSEPGGGGYVAQRMFSARSERHAMGATLLFNVAHYALRPWPWILIGLASLVVFPTVESLQAAFPHADASRMGEDVAYPAMLTLLPSGLLGLVAASLLAAFMSTMSTQVNLGASYLVNDFYKRFWRPDASERELVWAGRTASALSVVLGCGMGLLLTDAQQGFRYLLLLGAGTGAIYILRWFWWRINAATEIVAMLFSLVVASYFTFFHAAPENPTVWDKLATTALPVAITTAGWIAACFFTPRTDPEVLARFVARVRPGGPGWAAVTAPEASAGKGEIGDGSWGVPFALLLSLLGCLTVYAALFATGYWLYGQNREAWIATILALGGALLLARGWKRLHTSMA